MENAPSFGKLYNNTLPYNYLITGFLILLHMLMDDYITHILESKLEKEDEKVYFMRIQQMKKGIITIAKLVHNIMSISGDHSVSIKSSSISPISDEPIPKSTPVLSKSTTSHKSHPFPTVSAFTELHVPSVLSHTPSVSTSTTLPSPNIGTFPTVTSIISPTSTDLTDISKRLMPLSSTNRLIRSSQPHLQPDNITSTSSSSDFSFGSANSQTNLQGYPMQHTLPGRGQHQLSPQDATLGYPQSLTTPLQSFYPATTCQSQQVRSSPGTASSQNQVISPNGLNAAGFGSSSLVSSYDTSLQQLNAGSQVISSSNNHQLSSMPSINQAFNFSRALGQPIAQAHTIPKGATIPTLPSILPDLIRGSGTPSLNRTNSSSTASLPSFTALNVPFPSTTATSNMSASSLSNSTNLSLFPGMYPYTPFVSIPTVPAQMNTPFPPAGIQMPNQPSAVAGYPYIPGVTPSLYSTPVTSHSSFTR